MVTRKILTLFCTLLMAAVLRGQQAYVNTQYGVFRLTGGAGSCDRIQVTTECGETNVMLSIAVYKDTLYYNTWNGELKRFKIGVPGSCETLMEYGALFNSMTVDKNGILYMASEDLFRYDPHTKEMTDLGLMPFNSMGDLAFYHDKLLLAGYDPEDWTTGLYEINVKDPSLSKLYMETPSFFGLLSYPVACGNSRYFGLLSSGSGTTDLVELDLVNKIVTGNTCTMPLDVLDAASSTETGMDTKVDITSLQVNKSCQSATGSVEIAALYPGDGNITFTLDNTVSNTTGLFAQLEPGTHRIHAAAPGGECSIDTSFTVLPAYNLVHDIVKINPDACSNKAGSISIDASSLNSVVTFSLVNTGVSQPTGVFTGLHGGRYDFHITDENGCSKDTSIALVENIPIGGCSDVFIPNAFTPNFDGKNDSYTINLPSSFKNITLQIFGRWGNIVCQAKGNAISWDGNYKGVPQPVGVYVYTLTFIDPSGMQKTLKGTLTLIR